MLERELAELREEDVDDDALGGRHENVVDELLVLVGAAVAADELHLRAGSVTLKARVLAVFVK